MSEQEAATAAEHEKFTQQFSKDLEQAMHSLATKYKGQVQDFAVVVNWTHENHQKPYPKLLIETLRDVNAPGFDPIRQAMELNDLLSMGANHVLRNTLYQVMQQANDATQLLAALQGQSDPEAGNAAEPAAPEPHSSGLRLVTPE